MPYRKKSVEELKQVAIHIDIISEDGLKEAVANGETVDVLPLSSEEKDYYKATGKAIVYEAVDESELVPSASVSTIGVIAKRLRPRKPSVIKSKWNRLMIQLRWWWMKMFRPRREEYLPKQQGNFRRID